MNTNNCGLNKMEVHFPLVSMIQRWEVHSWYGDSGPQRLLLLPPCLTICRLWFVFSLSKWLQPFHLSFKEQNWCRGRKVARNRYQLSFKEVFLEVLSNRFCLYLIGKNLVTWPHLGAKGDWEIYLFWAFRCPGKN